MYTTLKKIAAVLLSVFLIAPTAVSAEQSQPVSVSSSAAAAVLYEPSSGTVLYEKHAHEKRPMASTTKLMTALLTVECLPLDRLVTVTAEAVSTEGSSMGLKAGDRVTVRDLLVGLLLSSGNDAANALAIETDGSLEAYAKRMNARAEAIGMTDSLFVTPSGLDAEGHGASALDMALLAAEVLKNDTLVSVCSSPSAEVTVSDRTLTLRNHNRLLRELDGCIGMKTGYTSKSGRCLVTAVQRDGLTLVAVTLDCANDWEEHRTMMEEGFSCFERVPLPLPPLKAMAVFGGELQEVALTGEPVSAVLPRASETPQATVTVTPYVWAPIESGACVGEVAYRVGRATVATVPLYAAHSVAALPRLPWHQRWQARFLDLLTTMLSG